MAAGSQIAQRQRRIRIVGDSHVNAIIAALRTPGAGPQHVDITARRIRKPGATGYPEWQSVKEAVADCARLGPGDLLVSAFGGNLHSVVGLIQHPQRFDVMTRSSVAADVHAAAQIVPNAALRSRFAEDVEATLHDWIAVLRDAGPQRTVHLSPPPPKADADYILTHSRTEAFFQASGLAEYGLSSADLRLRLWSLYTEVSRDILGRTGITLLPPPPGTQTPEGYLRPEFYARDATHANPAYGARVLDQVAAIPA